MPAGRMEPGEDIVEAVKREVLEETGIHFEPSTLLLVESAGTKRVSPFFRFEIRFEKLVRSWWIINLYRLCNT